MPKSSVRDEGPQLWVEEGQMRVALLVTVAPAAPIDKLYTFTTDEKTAARLTPGQRVIVPFGRKDRLAPAYVVGVTRGPWTSTLKPVAAIDDSGGGMSATLLELGQWLARYYACPLGRTLAAMIPEPVRSQAGFATVRRVERVIAEDVIATGRVGTKQRAILDTLGAVGNVMDTAALLTAAHASRATLRALIDRGWVRETVTREFTGLAPRNDALTEPAFTLNEAQEEAIAAIGRGADAGSFSVHVLFGVSGSGKTEVYVHAIRHVLARGRQAIMLVPEIALTTQILQRLAARFEHVAVVHSGLTAAQRSRTWEAIRRGEASVVIGTRSAVFAPCPNLGLIVVDEEQETSYKNLQAPRFHVRDVAIKRAHLLGIPVVLGSATPSLETWWNLTHHPAYQRLDLPRRVHGRGLPGVQLVDTVAEGAVHGMRITLPLKHALTETLAKGDQAVLLLNRRGYATWLMCTRCKQRLCCPNCQAAMVLHLNRKQVRCHHCHRNLPVPRWCADLSCRGPMEGGGGGTEKIEEQLRAFFPDARIHRADSDTMTHADKYTELVRAFEAEEIDILIGTQMIAKGLDFPGVALVGVIGAELAGAMNDFRGSERLFQLVTQVAGRAGRAERTGRVIVQTSMPELPALRLATTHDYVSFATAELTRREQTAMPPVTRMARFVVSERNDRQAQQSAEALTERITTALTRDALPARLMGPHPCAIERIRNQYRWELLLLAPHTSALLAVMEKLRGEVLGWRGQGGYIVDVDPVDLS